jgi:hypothetical protein
MTDLAPYLGRLKTFKLLGCRHVTEVGFMPIIAGAADTLEVLGLREVGYALDVSLGTIARS